MKKGGVALKEKNILIPGASGQIGEALALALAKDNTVTGMARFGSEAVRKRLENAGVRAVVRDLAADDLADLKDEYDVVFNQAVDWPGPPERGVDVPLAMNGYLQGRLMERCPSAIHIFGSTMSVPDNVPPLIDEETPTRRQSNTYSSTKLVGESLAVHLSRERGIKAAILRYMWPCGSRQLRVPYDALLGVVRQALQGDTFKLEPSLLCLPPDGLQTREISGSTPTPLHVDDGAALTIKAAAIAATPPEIIHVFGPQIPMSEALAEIASVFEVKVNTEIVEQSEKKLVACYNTAKMKRLLGEQTIPLRQILEQLRSYMQKSGEVV